MAFKIIVTMIIYYSLLKEKGNISILRN